ncbi:unnamed protein product [Trichobilharzia szidati]|nr:unnamed protein product [Trichobilharzia szidati]
MKMMCFFQIYFILHLLQQLYASNRIWEQELKMPSVHTEEEDSYVCAYFQPPSINETNFIRGIFPNANRSTVHHMILKGCSYPVKTIGKIKKCGGCETVLYAWAMNAPPLRFPLGVGYPVGINAPIKGFELEVHYLNPVKSDQSGLRLIVTNQHQPRIAGVFLLLRSDAVIPPGIRNYPVDVSCRISSTLPITIMAIRGHAHSLGRSVVGFRLPHGQRPAQLLGRVNPQIPQAFYPLKQLDSEFDSVEVNEDDIIMARCVYDSTSRTHNVGMGSTHHDEMCNLYILYHSSAFNTFGDQGGFCTSDVYESQWNLIQENASESARKSSLVTKPPGSSDSEKSSKMLLSTRNPIEIIQPSSISENVLLHDTIKLGQASSVETRAKSNNGQHELIILHRGSNIWTYDSFNKHFIYQNEADYIKTETVLHVNPLTGSIEQKWGKNMFILPHSITLSYFMDGNGNTTSRGGGEQQRRRIMNGQPTAVWITDVALHQVFKFDWMKWDKPSLTLGLPGRPGNNRRQFCQPADVAISSKGDIFVADGYCNSRIVKFSSNGDYLTEWSAIGLGNNQDYQSYLPHIPRPVSQGYWSPDLLYTESNDEANMDLNRYDFKVVHSLTIIPSDEDGSLEQVCAADRENAAVLCYTLDGKLIRRYADSSIQPSVYAIQYDPEHKVIVGLTGRTVASTVDSTLNNDNEWLSPNLFFINPYRPKSVDELYNRPYNPFLADSYQGSAIVGFFSLVNVMSPHDLALSPKSDIIYVSEINPNIVHRFEVINKMDIKGIDGRKELAEIVAVTNYQIWNLHTLTPYQLTALSIILFIVIIFLLIGCIRICWCGRRSTTAATIATARRGKHDGKVFAISPKSSDSNTNMNGIYSRWSAKRKLKKNKQAGFRPLIRNSNGPDYFAEQELDDYIDEEEEEENGGGAGREQTKYNEHNQNSDEDVLMDSYADRHLLKHSSNNNDNNSNHLNRQQKFIPKVTSTNPKKPRSTSLSSKLFRLKTGVNQTGSVA